MKTLTIFAFSILLSISAIAQTASNKVYINGVIYTSNDDQPFAEAIVIDSDSIVFVGSNENAEFYIVDGAEVYDLEGKLILPGFHDVHIHLLEAGGSGDICLMSSTAFSTQNLANQLNNCAPDTNSNGWIFSWGYSIFTILEGSFQMPKLYLDEYFPDTPVAAMEETSHSAWVNSAALDILGYNAETPDPPGGHIVKDPDTGEPTGLLLDAAGDAAFELAFISNATNDQEYYDGLINFGLPAIAQNGITSICEGRTYWNRNYINIWNDVKDNNELTARVVLAPYAFPENEDEEQIEVLSELFNEGDDMLRVNQIKLYIDGITWGGTAALDQPYVYVFGWPFNNGLNYFEVDRLEDYITELELLGFDFHIHAIGNRGVKEALDAIEGARFSNGDVGARHRLTHLEIVNEEEYARFAELSVIADMQVQGEWTQPNSWDESVFLIGSTLSDDMIPLKSLYDAGAMVTLSSDWDVSSMNPFIGIEHAVTRSPQNLPSVEEAVKSYTINGAYVMRQEGVTGSLEVGKYADLICVDQNIFDIPESQISQTNVTLTILGGEVVYAGLNAPTLIDVVDSKQGQINVLPNIVSDQTRLTMSHILPGKYELEIVDSSGKIISSESIQIDNPFEEKIINVSQFSEGLYVIYLKNNKRSIFSERIVVSR